MRHHIFADESGCLAFKRSRHTSKYFILCTVATNDPRIGQPLLDLRRELSWSGECDDAFHATTDAQAVRDRVFSLISEMNLRIDATILEKSKAQPQTRGAEHQFYKYAWYYHFKHVAPRIVGQDDQLHLTAASLGTKKKKNAFRDAINDVARQTLPNIEHQLAFWPADSDPCLQVADYCAWAIQRKWERQDHRSYDLIKDNIYSEFDLWRKGNEHYY